MAADSALQRHLKTGLLADFGERAELGVIWKCPAIGGFLRGAGAGMQAGQAGGRAIKLADGGRLPLFRWPIISGRYSGRFLKKSGAKKLL